MHVDHQLDIQPLTAERFEDLAALFHTGLARVCWDMEPRQTAATAAWASEGLDASLHDAGSVRPTRLMRPAAHSGGSICFNYCVESQPAAPSGP